MAKDETTYGFPKDLIEDQDEIDAVRGELKIQSASWSCATWSAPSWPRYLRAHYEQQAAEENRRRRS
ncbi:hypothetical protein AB0D78_47015 [Streptomyces avermitilis]|uniref:hypothetical protein n=1 Tax=Streptomyces avermitilis TaxID=33903 RepID=UPI0033F93D68